MPIFFFWDGSNCFTCKFESGFTASDDLYFHGDFFLCNPTLLSICALSPTEKRRLFNSWLNSSLFFHFSIVHFTSISSDAREKIDFSILVSNSPFFFWGRTIYIKLLLQMFRHFTNCTFWLLMLPICLSLYEFFKVDCAWNVKESIWGKKIVEQTIDISVSGISALTVVVFCAPFL